MLLNIAAPFDGASRYGEVVYCGTQSNEDELSLIEFDMDFGPYFPGREIILCSLTGGPYTVTTPIDFSSVTVGGESALLIKKQYETQPEGGNHSHAQVAIHANRSVLPSGVLTVSYTMTVNNTHQTFLSGYVLRTTGFSADSTASSISTRSTDPSPPTLSVTAGGAAIAVVGCRRTSNGAASCVWPGTFTEDVDTQDSIQRYHFSTAHTSEITSNNATFNMALDSYSGRSSNDVIAGAFWEGN